MRRGSLLLIVGVALIVLGVSSAWYYATVTYPAWATQFENGCASQRVPAPCASLAPASDQSPYVLGEFVTAIGAITAFAGGVRFALATVRPAPRLRRQV
jgi:hypothetical protein